MTTSMTTRPITLRTLDEKEVQVDASAIEAAGFVDKYDADEHCGHDLDAAYEEGERDGRLNAFQSSESDAGRILEQWHNDHHAGPYQFCYEQPCHDIRKAGDS